MKTSTRAVVVAVGLCLTSASALAQVAIPPAVEPGQIQRQIEQMRPAPSGGARRVRPVPQQVPPSEAGATTFVYQGVDLEGVTAYPAATLLAGVEPAVGSTISVAAVFELANRLTARYRNDGYLLSQVLVPAQTLGTGRVKLLAVEGYLADVRFRGAPNDALLSRYAAALKAERPLQADVLERYLLLLNDAGLGTAHGTLVPSASVTGASDLVVEFDARRWAASASIGNRASRSLGPLRGELALDAMPGVLGWDRLALRAGSTLGTELNYVALSYGAALGDGLAWSVGGTGVRSRPGRAANFADVDLKTRSVSGIAQLNYAWIRTRSLNFAPRIALTSFDGRSQFSLADLSDDRIRAVRVGLAADATDVRGGISTLDVEYSRGVDALGAKLVGTPTSPLSRARGRADFAKFNLYAARLQDIAGPWSLLFAASAQYTSDPLLAPELFAVGGEPFGRGHDAAELVGDSGEAAKAELRFDGVAGARSAYTAYAYYDWGRVRRKDPINEPERESATSCGLGVRANLARGWQGHVEVAKPLNRDVAAEGNRSVRLFAGLHVAL